MSEAERIEVPGGTLESDAPQEAEAAATLEITPTGEGESAPESAEAQDGLAAEDVLRPDEAAGETTHGLSDATLESMARTDPQAQTAAEAERTKWERRKALVRDCVQRWCRQYMADGGFKLGIALVTAVIASAIIVIAGIFSDRMLGVVFWRAVIGFFVSGIFMGGALYWLDRFGIPLFIEKHEDQIQMDWLAEAEEPEPGEEGDAPEAEEDEAEPGELEELMPQEGEETPQEGEGAALPEEGSAEAPEKGADSLGSPPENGTDAEGDVPGEAQPTEEAAGAEGMDGLENAVLDDAFSSADAEGEVEEPPTFAPMTAENLENLSVPEGS